MSRYNLSRSHKTVTLQDFCWGQCRGTNCLEARKLSRCRIYIACRCAHPERSEGRVQEPLRIYLGSRSKSKNRDKRLTHIVRVMVSSNF